MTQHGTLEHKPQFESKKKKKKNEKENVFGLIPSQVLNHKVCFKDRQFLPTNIFST